MNSLKLNYGEIGWQLTMCFLLTGIIMMVPDLAHAGAGGDNKISIVLCNVIEFFNGNTGKAIATLAVIVIGVGALMGKVSWGMAIIVVIGIGVIFGAKELVNLIADNGSGNFCS